MEFNKVVDVGALLPESLLKSMHVSRVMSAPVITVDADESLESASRVMLEGEARLAAGP